MSNQDACIKELALRLARGLSAEGNYLRDRLIVALADKVVELQDAVTRLEGRLDDHENSMSLKPKKKTSA